MSHYVGRASPPRCLSRAEQEKLLYVSGEHRAGYRDHVILALALATGLRESEIQALNVDDVRTPDGGVRTRIALRVFKGAAKGGQQEVLLSDAIRHKLKRYLAQAPAIGPLFLSQRGLRISCRQLRRVFLHWQEKAGFERRFRFHDLRHTFCTNAYRASGRDIVQVRRLARHAKIETSLIYTHASEDELAETLSKLPS